MPNAEQRDYIHLIHSRGFRATPQRQMIMDAIRTGGHQTAEEIYNRVHEKAPTLNRATVYRTLDFLCELRLVVAADMGGGRWVYEPAGDAPHHHLVCRTCGVVMQLDHAEVQEFFARLLEAHDFLVDMDHLALFGLCPRCRQQAKAL